MSGKDGRKECIGVELSRWAWIAIREERWRMGSLIGAWVPSRGVDVFHTVTRKDIPSAELSPLLV